MKTPIWWLATMFVFAAGCAETQSPAPTPVAVAPETAPITERIAPPGPAITNLPAVSPNEIPPVAVPAAETAPASPVAAAPPAVEWPPIDLSPLQTVFDGADAGTKQTMMDAAALIRAGHYEKAREVLAQTLAVMHFSPDQTRAINAVLAQLRGRPDLP